MIATLATIAICALLAALTQAWWRSYLNPVTLGVLVWLPGMIMLHWPPFFLSPLYIHLNRPISPLVYIALALGFGAFWAGCAVVKALSKPDAFAIQPLRLNADNSRLFLVFGLGLALFVYSYLRSGLTDIAYLDEQGVAEARVGLHLGLLSFFILFLDIGATGFFVRFLQTGRWVFAVPMALAMICYGLTLQKSPILQLIAACLVLMALHPRASRYLFWRSTARKAVLAAIGVAVLASLSFMNQARGISVVQMTGASNPVLEQLYIYSGASAIMNVSVTIEGYLPSDPPRFGLYLGRPLLWYVFDRDLFSVARSFEGINTGTYLIYGWADFRWFGFLLMPFLTGVLVMLFLRAGVRGSLVGIMLAVTAARAVVFSSTTDVLFDPTTWILIALSLAVHLAVKHYRVSPAARTNQRVPTVVYPNRRHSGSLPRTPTANGPAA